MLSAARLSTAQHRPSAPPEMLVLGFHQISHPGRDLFDTQNDDVLAPKRESPPLRCTDGELLAGIRRTIQESPFPGEGHPKGAGRPRIRGVRKSLQRVPRLVREHELLAPHGSRSPSS